MVRAPRIAGVKERGTWAQGFPWNLGDLLVSMEFGNGTAVAGFQARAVGRRTAWQQRSSVDDQGTARRAETAREVGCTRRSRNCP